MFRKVTITVEGGEAKDLVVRLLRTVSTAVPMILEGSPGVVAATQSQIKLEEFDPCLPENIPEDPPSLTKCVMNSLQVREGPRLYDDENIPDRRRENGY